MTWFFAPDTRAKPAPEGRGNTRNAPGVSMEGNFYVCETRPKPLPCILKSDKGRRRREGFASEPKAAGHLGKDASKSCRLSRTFSTRPAARAFPAPPLEWKFALPLESSVPRFSSLLCQSSRRFQRLHDSRGGVAQSRSFQRKGRFLSLNRAFLGGKRRSMFPSLSRV